MKHVVSENGSNSDIEIITSGVPQGSILLFLGPYLHLCYANDMQMICLLHS